MGGTTQPAQRVNAITAVHDGRAGNARQACALAQALGEPGAMAGDIMLQPGLLARWLAPRTWPGICAPFGAGFRACCEDPPALAIGCGRQAALATRLLRQRGAQVVQILDPRIDPRHWDLVIAPEHDDLHADNVLPMLGSLHPVDDVWLAQARQAFAGFAVLPSPRTVLLVGGPSRHAPLGDADFEQLLLQLSAQAQAERGSLSVVASRRTRSSWRDAIARVPADLPGLRWRGVRDGANPYAGLLAHAGRIVCTPDSVNMLSEAVATRVPVFAWRADAVNGRPRQFLERLSARGRIRALDDAAASFTVEPLRETPRIAGLVRARLGLRG